MTQPTILYNGSCPVCCIEIEHYRRPDADAGTSFAYCDISGAAASAAGGIDPEAIRRRLHLVIDDGRLLVGVPAFARIWERLPSYRWLARLVRLPVVATLAAWIYEPLSATLYALDRRRRAGGAA